MRTLPTIQVIDNFCPAVERVILSARVAGFGTWSPATKGEVGSSRYEGMGFYGDHAYMVHSLTMAMGCHVYPNAMFFRVTNVGMEKAYVHSDREAGDWTCVAYLSDHKDVSGTGFFRHRKTGMVQMPTFAQMRKSGTLRKLGREMVGGSEKHWEQTDFIRGIFNRAVIFSAPLFHARIPRGGLGSSAADGRLVWVCHFNIE